MIAVAAAVIAAVILLTGGVVVDSDVPGTLAFFGVTVHTTSAQIFLTGAICTWVLLAASWLLTAGIRRSRKRGAQLALLRGRPRAGAAISEPVEPAPGLARAGEVAGMFGFAVRGRRASADRPGARGGGDRVDSRHDAAEEPLRG